MRIAFFALVIVGFISGNKVLAQGEVVSSTWNEQGLAVGSAIAKYPYLELGYYRASVSEAGGLPSFASTLSIGTEMSYHEDMIIAPKIQARLSLLSGNISLATLYYTNLKNQHSLKLRPEISVGLFYFDIGYAYTVGILDQGLEKVSRHQLILRFYKPLKKTNLQEYDREGNIVKR